MEEVSGASSARTFHFPTISSNHFPIVVLSEAKHPENDGFLVAAIWCFGPCCRAICCRSACRLYE